MEPILQRLKARYGDRVDFIRVNVDDPASAAKKAEFHVWAIPTYVLLDRDDNQVGGWIGVTSEDKLISAIENVLASP